MKKKIRGFKEMWGHRNSFRPFHRGLRRNSGYLLFLGGSPWEAVPRLTVGAFWSSSWAIDQTASVPAVVSQMEF